MLLGQHPHRSGLMQLSQRVAEARMACCNRLSVISSRGHGAHVVQHQPGPASRGPPAGLANNVLMDVYWPQHAQSDAMARGYSALTSLRTPAVPPLLPCIDWSVCHQLTLISAHTAADTHNGHTDPCHADYGTIGPCQTAGMHSIYPDFMNPYQHLLNHQCMLSSAACLCLCNGQHIPYYNIT